MGDEARLDELIPRLWVWGHRDDQPRFLLAMLRVKNLDRSLHFYVDGLGMKAHDRYDIESQRTSAVFVGFGDYTTGGLLELSHPWDGEGDYTHGSGYGHIALGVPDVVGMIAKLETMGTEITLRPAPLIPGGPCVAFIKDPDGYAIELVQTRRE